MSDILDRTSDRLSAQTITLYGCMDRHSCYIPFYSQAQLYIWKDSCRINNPLKNYPLKSTPSGDHQGPDFSDNLTSWGTPQTETVSYNNWEAYNLGVH